MEFPFIHLKFKFKVQFCIVFATLIHIQLKLRHWIGIKKKKKQFSIQFTIYNHKDKVGSCKIASRWSKVKGRGIIWHLLGSCKGKIYWQGHSWTNPNCWKFTFDQYFSAEHRNNGDHECTSSFTLSRPPFPLVHLWRGSKIRFWILVNGKRKSIYLQWPGG